MYNIKVIVIGKGTDGLEIEVAVAKIGKWATSESGDTLEMIERPHGGLSLVLIDGQRSGKAAKAISNLVARKAISELAEGVRDGAAARAANDYLFTYKQGKVSATLNIVSVDLITNTIVLSRNSHCPSIVITPEEGLTLLDEPAEPVGRKRGTRPQITELPLHLGTTVIVYTDGLKMAGARSTPIFDIPQAVRALRGEAVLDAAQLANQLLKRALELDDGRPRDDISVLVLRIVDSQGDGIRQMNVSIPI